MGALPCLALAASAGGCSLFSGANKPAPNKYWLQTVHDFPGELPQAEWQLVIKPVTASMGLDTVLIARRGHSPYLLDYFDGAVWSETAPRMVQMLVLEAFEKSGKIEAVGHEETGIVADYILQLDLHDFTVNSTSPNTGYISVVVGARVIALEDASIVGSRRFEYNEYYGGADRDTRSRRKKDKSVSFSIFVAAFSRATEAMCGEVVAWTLNAGDLHYQSTAAAKAAAKAARAPKPAAATS